jgi:lipoate-protein ligase A
MGTMCSFFILDSGKSSAPAHMGKDEQLLHSLKFEQKPILHFYEFERPSFTYGYFTKVEKFLKPEGISSLGLDHAKRPTGGGITFHMSDFTFSILIPNTFPTYSHNPLINYAFIHSIVSKVLEKVFKKRFDYLQTEKKEGIEGFCSTKPTQYDLLYQGKKICGAAQRKKPWGYLHQGTIFLAPIQPCFTKDLFINDQVLGQIEKSAYYPIELKQLNTYKRAIKKAFIETIK